MKYKIIPTVFSLKEEDFEHRLERLVKVSKDLHIDFMDGRFVKSHFLNFDIIPNLGKYKSHIFEAHMMVLNPQRFLKELKEKGFKKIIIHFESVNDKKELVKISKSLRKEKIKFFLGINPETKLTDFLHYINEIDGVMFMGVHPGKEHQRFIYEILENVRQLRHFNKKIDIQVDGGVNSSNIHFIKKAGVNLFNSGSFVSESEKPKEAILKLKKEIK